MESLTEAESSCNEFKMSLSTCPVKFVIPIYITVAVAHPGMREENTFNMLSS